MEIRTLRKREGDLGEEAGSGFSSWRSFWMSLKEEQEKLRERVPECDGDGGGVLRKRLGELSHDGHMGGELEGGQKEGFFGGKGSV